MIKQNPMNNIIKVVETDGYIGLLELSRSQTSELISEFFEECNQEERKEVFRKLFVEKLTFECKDGRKITIIS